MKERKQKSVPIPKETQRRFIRWVESNHTNIQAADRVGINRVTMKRICESKNPSCAPETLQKIETVIQF